MEKGKSNKRANKKISMVDANTAIWIITLNVNGLNTMPKGRDIYIKTRLNYALYINSLKYKNIDRLLATANR